MPEDGGVLTAEKVDLSSCDRELVQYIEAIQPHGALLALREPAWQVIAASANTGELLGVPTEDLLNRPLMEMLPEGSALWLENALRQFNPEAVPVHLGAAAFPQNRFEVFAYRSGDSTILDFELIPAQTSSTAGLYAQVRSCISELQRTRALEDVLSVAVNHIRRLTGYDRVLAFKFLGDGTGHILAEDRRGDLSSFLGLHFPPGDVPAPARRVLSLVWVRYQPDIAYAPVPVLSAFPQAAPLDLSYSALRSTSAMCNRYYLNLGVRSKQIVALLHEGEMWGAVICQHETPMHVPHEVRMACETIGHTVSMLLIEREKTMQAQKAAEIRRNVIGFLDKTGLDGARQQAEGVEKLTGELLACIPADGAAWVTRKAIQRLASTPEDAEIRAIVAWLEERSPAEQHTVFSTHSLSSCLPQAARFVEEASGLLAVGSGEGEYALWFRAETRKVVSWAGDPEKPVEVDQSSGQLRLAPRKSFEMRRSLLRGLSEPWTAGEREAAAALQLAMATARRIASLHRDLDELKATKNDLEAFAYTAAHDLREPLRGIANASKLLERGLPETLGVNEQKRLSTIQRLTYRMDDLLASLLRCSSASQGSPTTTVADMNLLAAEAIETLEGLYPGASIQVEASLPAVACDRAQILEVVTNLIVNGLKYNDSDRKEIEIGFQNAPEPAFYVRDNGIGVAPEHHQVVFDLFRRLHEKDAYGGGTGAGLAIVKKIIERHGGRIWLQSAPGAGTTVFFTLQANAPAAAETSEAAGAQ